MASLFCLPGFRYRVRGPKASACGVGLHIPMALELKRIQEGEIFEIVVDKVCMCVYIIYIQ